MTALLHPIKNNYQLIQGFGGSPEVYSRFGLLGHNGLDYACQIGTPVYAARDGVPTKIQTDPDGYGLHVRLSHYQNGIEVARTIYAHLSEVDCRLGQQCPAGALIAESGNSGFSTTPHLHFEYRPIPLQSNGYNGAVDPTPLFAVQPASDTDSQASDVVTPALDISSLPQKGIATVIDCPSGLKIRTNTDESDTSSFVGYWLDGKSFPYDKIVEEGGDYWLSYDIGGRTHYSALFIGRWYCSVSEV